MTSTSRRFAHTKWPEGLQNPPVVFSRSVARSPGEWDNPAHGPLISTLRRTYGDDLIHLATEGTRYIRDVVAQLLDRDCGEQGHLRFLVDAARDAAFQRYTVFTLNHDVPIERALQAAGILYTDGTSQIGPACWRWSAENLDSQMAGTRLYKLHGSIGWHHEMDDSSVSDRSTGPGSRSDLRRLPASSDRRTPDPRGNARQVFNYVQGIFADLFYAFRECLRRNAGVLVVCGYGFRDKFINAVVLEWLDGDQSRLVVIHGDPN